MINREKIIQATLGLIVERGTSVPTDLIARKANVGIATLYRHFPDRSELLRQVALDAILRCGEVAASALAEDPDAFAALARYMHESIDLQIGVVMPILADHIKMDEEVVAARHRTREQVEALVDAAHREGSLRPDISSGDIGLLIIRLTPPLPGDMSPEDNHHLSHRHLELILDGLLRSMHTANLPGPLLSVEELSRINSKPADGYITTIADIRSTRRAN